MFVFVSYVQPTLIEEIPFLTLICSYLLQRCKTGRWSTLQASVFLHSTAIGNAKSSTVAGIGVAAANPFLIPLMAGIGIAAVGTPWLLLKMANDKWTEATMSLNDQFWMQAKPEVFVDCIEKWSKLG